ARLGGARHPRGSAARAARVIVYGRNPVHEAVRGPRRVARAWAAAGAARECWLASLNPAGATGDERERLCCPPGEQGVCAEGLRPRVRAACDELIALPVRGRIGSLNVSAAASAVVYGILQSRRLSVDKAP